MRTWTKICGVTRRQDALAAAAAGADAIGINFYSQSPRYCETEAAREIVDAVSGTAGGCVVYGVFVDASRAQIERTVEATGITGVQLHGNEDASLVEGWTLPVLRSVPAKSADQVAAAIVARAGERFLLDNPLGGGTGRQFDAAAVAGLDLSSVVVAGGLKPGNVADVVSRLKPYGVDTAGGVESAPGIKDPTLIKEFIRNASAA